MLGVKYGKGDYKNKDSHFVKNYEAFVKNHSTGFDPQKHQDVLSEVKKLQVEASKEYRKHGDLKSTLTEIDGHITKYLEKSKENRDLLVTVDINHMEEIKTKINERRYHAISLSEGRLTKAINKKPPPCRKVPTDGEIKVNRVLSWYSRAKHALLEIEHYHIANNTTKEDREEGIELFLTLENGRDMLVKMLAHDAHMKRSLKPKKHKKSKKPRKPKTEASPGQIDDSDIVLAPHPETQLTARAFPDF